MQTFITKQPVSLINLAPEILNSTCSNPPIYVPGTGNGVNPLGTFKVIQATNGAAFGVGISNPQGWKDLTWRLTVTKGGVDYGPLGNGSVFINQYQANQYWTASFNFTGGDTPSGMPDGTYACVATVEDAGALTDVCNFNLVINRTPCYTYKRNYQGTGNVISATYTDCSGDGTAAVSYVDPPSTTFPGYDRVCARDNQTTLINAGYTKLALNSTDPANTCNVTL